MESRALVLPKNLRSELEETPGANRRNAGPERPDWVRPWHYKRRESQPGTQETCAKVAPVARTGRACVGIHGISGHVGDAERHTDSSILHPHWHTGIPSACVVHCTVFSHFVPTLASNDPKLPTIQS